MKVFPGSLLVALFLSFTAASLRAQIPNFAPADLVIGQPNFVAGEVTFPASGANFNGNVGIAISPVSGKLFVADFRNNRVLRFASTAALTNGIAAEAVFGQPNLTSTDSNRGALAAANSFAGPVGITVDATDRLWVADSGNSRVLAFPNASNGTDPNATVALGQPDLTSFGPGTSATTMSLPASVVVDSSGRLFVGDRGNNRVLIYPSAANAATGDAATGFVGQPDFDTGDPITAINRLRGPAGIFVDATGILWVADSSSQRVVGFPGIATNAAGPNASLLIGQPNFTSSEIAAGPTGLSFPSAVTRDAFGNLWIIDGGNNRVLRFAPASLTVVMPPADLVVGQPNFTATAVGTSDRLLAAPDIALLSDSNGALWVSDSGNSRVLRFPADRTAPTLTLRGKRQIKTSRPRLVLRGAAADSGGVASILVKGPRKPFQAARLASPNQPTTNWSKKVRLDRKRPKFVIRVVATDTVGNRSAVLRVRVTRR